MRRLSWMLVAVCLLALPLWGQSRKRGYTPAGGWHHHKSPSPAPAPKKKIDRRPQQAPVPAPPTR